MMIFSNEKEKTMGQFMSQPTRVLQFIFLQLEELPHREAYQLNMARYTLKNIKQKQK